MPAGVLPDAPPLCGYHSPDAELCIVEWRLCNRFQKNAFCKTALVAENLLPPHFQAQD